MLVTRIFVAAVTVLVLDVSWASPQSCSVPSPAIASRNLLVRINPTWGGIISAVVPVRTCTNIINNGIPDPGRQVQLAFRRGETGPKDCWVCEAGCNAIWNPTQGGSPCPQPTSTGSGVIAFDVTPPEIHSLSQIYNFDNDDGRSNIYVEQWTSIPKGNAIEINYLAESQEPFTFTDTQEFPVVFVQPTLNTAYRYTGAAPWTGAAAEVVAVPEGVNEMPRFNDTTEPWLAWINSSDGYGLALYIPTTQPHTEWQYHRVNDPGTTPTHAMQNWVLMELNQGDQVTQQAFLVYGTLDMIRSTIYEYEGYPWFHDAGGFSPWLNKLLRNSVTGGCGVNPPMYCPGSNIPREQMAVFLTSAKHGPAYTPPACTTAPFSDVPVSHPFCRWIRAAKDQGVMLGGAVEGCGTGAFCPSNTVTRAHMAAFLLRAKDGGSYLPPVCGEPMFSDVAASHPYCRWIEELARRNITGGCGEGVYCPDSPNTRGQMAVFISVNWDLK